MGALENFTHITDDNVMLLIHKVREGITYPYFTEIANMSSFSMKEWAHYLHITERTLQRYKSDDKSFEPLQSEKILEITLMYKKGLEVFEDKESFDLWLNTNNVGLGNRRPKELLDSNFGIQMIKDELARIEHGVLS